MSKKIYVGNLPFTATEDEVREIFAAHGEVETVSLISDRYTGQPRGFGFVEMEDGAADVAIAGLNNTSFGGRTLRVSLARQREDGPPDGGGGGEDRDNRW